MAWYSGEEYRREGQAKRGIKAYLVCSAIVDISATPTDKKIVADVKRAILKNVGGEEGFKRDFPKLLRRAFDEVIDTPRTGRLTFDQTEKTEKTYMGTKIEIFFRAFIGYPKGLLDLNVDGMDVDIKNTVGSNWMIPQEAFNKPCILIAANEKTARCKLGILVARPKYLSKGSNRDQKKSITSNSFKHIDWILFDCPYPQNIWETVAAAKVKRIFSARGGTQRLVQLFKEMEGIPISRTVIEGIAQQKDYMKRLRKNGGARDELAQSNIAVLSGVYDKALIRALGIPVCSGEEFISFKAESAEHKKLLRNHLT